MIGSLFQLTTTLLVLVIVSQLSSFTLSNPSTSSSSALTSTYLPPYSLLYCTDSKEYCLYSRQIAQNSTIQLLLAAQKTTLWAAFGFGSSMMQADVFLSWPNTGNKGVTVSRRVAQGFHLPSCIPASKFMDYSVDGHFIDQSGNWNVTISVPWANAASSKYQTNGWDFTTGPQDMIYSANTFKAPSSSDACGASIVMHDVRGTPDNAVNLYIAPSTTTTTTTTIKKQTTTSTSKKTTLSTKSPSFSSGQPSPTLTPCNEMCVNSCIYNSTLACTRDHTCVKVNPGDKSCCPSYHCVKNSTFTASTTQLAHTTTNKKTITTSIRTSTKKTSTTSLKVLEG